jgi:hypothetical protein
VSRVRALDQLRFSSKPGRDGATERQAPFIDATVIAHGQMFESGDSSHPLSYQQVVAARGILSDT